MNTATRSNRLSDDERFDAIAVLLGFDNAGAHSCGMFGSAIHDLQRLPTATVPSSKSKGEMAQRARTADSSDVRSVIHMCTALEHSLEMREKQPCLLQKLVQDSWQRQMMSV